MNTMVAFAIYCPFFIISLVVCTIELFRSYRNRALSWFNFLCLCVVCWFASEIAGLLSNRYETLRFMSNFKLIFVGFVPPASLLTVLRFYQIWKKDHKRKLHWLLFIVPILNIPVILLSNHHSLMVDIQVVSLAPFRDMTYVWGPWFRVHTAYSYVVSFAIIVTFVVSHIRLPHFYRLLSTLVGCGVSMTLLGNMITLVQFIPPIIDPTLLTCSVSLVMYNVAISNNNNSKFVRFSHSQIYHYLDEYILILDADERVLEWNRPAENWLSGQGITLKDAYLGDILQALGGETAEAEDNGGLNIYLLERDFPVVLNLRRHEISASNQNISLSIAIFTDITQTWTLIQKLEEKAGVDSLTGVPNHMAYTGAKKRLNAPAHLPLSIIMCDINGLKHVNDSLGHQYGDLMIRTIAQVLETVCAPPNFLARIGGDEFICLLPKTPEAEAQRVEEQISGALSEITQYPFTPSLALGIATKTAQEEDIDALIAEADSRMYQKKKLHKQKIG